MSTFLCPPQVTTDKKSLAYVDNMLKKSNKKVEELHQELQELNAHIVVKDPEERLGNYRTRRTESVCVCGGGGVISVRSVNSQRLSVAQCTPIIFWSVSQAFPVVFW